MNLMSTTELDLSLRMLALEERVESLEKGRSGRRGKPILVSIEGVCGVDPKRESISCPDASLYRRQKGCMGEACMKKSSEYYAGYRTTKVKVRKRKK
jgi:hypothetical protein